MTEKRWKRKEREVARMLGGKRNVEKGIPQPDVEGPDFVCEVKDRQRPPAFLYGAIATARAHGKNRGKFPLVVLTAPKHNEPVVFMGAKDFLTLWKAMKASEWDYRITKGE